MYAGDELIIKKGGCEADDMKLFSKFIRVNFETYG